MDDRGTVAPKGSARRRVLIADDHEILVDMLANLLEPEFDVVARATDGLRLIELAEKKRPDIIIADIGMPGCPGLEAGRRILTARPEIRLVYLTMQSDRQSAAEAFASGAAGYVLKSGSTTEFLKALRRIEAGGRYLSAEIAGGDVDALTAEQHGNSLSLISMREREVLALLVSGLPMKAVARKLGITPRTVAFHKYKAMELLGLHGNAQLMEFALQHGLLNFNPATIAPPSKHDGKR